jgi:hypothetical protein
MIRAGHHGPNPPRHRTHGPDTSREAAESLDPEHLNRSCAEVLEVLRSAGPVGATTDQVCTALGRLDLKSSISRRLTDLGEAGLAEIVGKRPGRSGRNQQVWAIRTVDPVQLELIP